MLCSSRIITFQLPFESKCRELSDIDWEYRSKLSEPNSESLL